MELQCGCLLLLGHTFALSHCCDEISGKSHLGKEGFTLSHSLTGQLILETAWRQKIEASAHTQSADRKQRAECYYNDAILPRVDFPPQLT